MNFNEIPQTNITLAVQGEEDDLVMVIQISLGKIIGMTAALTPEEAGQIGGHLLEFSRSKTIITPSKGVNRIKIKMPNGDWDA